MLQKIGCFPFPSIIFYVIISMRPKLAELDTMIAQTSHCSGFYSVISTKPSLFFVKVIAKTDLQE